MTPSDFIAKAEKIVFDHLSNNNFGSESLAKEMGLSRSQLFKKLKLYNGKSISQFINEVRLKEGHKLLKSGSLSISEVAYQTGFASPTYFSSCFKKRFGFSPSSIQKFISDSEPNGITKRQSNIYTLLTGRFSWIFIVFVPIAILTSILGFTYIISKNPNEPIAVKSLAVLRFDSERKDSLGVVLADGLPDEIVNSLSNLGALKILSATSSFRVDKNDEYKDIAQKLGVRYLVDGKLQNTGGQIRTTVKLVDTETGFQVWSDNFEEDYDSYFKLQEQIAKKVVNALEIKLLPDQEQSFAQRKTNSFKAFEYYTKAKALGELRKEGVLREATDLLEKAIELDPEFAEAYAELSFLSGQRHFYGNLSIMERDKRMRTNVGKAVALAPDNPDVIIAKMDYLMKIGDYAKDSTRIIQVFRQVLRRRPNDARATYRLYRVFTQIDKQDLAHKYLKETVELDPVNSFYRAILGRDLFWKMNKREEGFRMIQQVYNDESKKRGVAFMALMLMDEPRGNLLEAFKVLHRAMKEEPYQFGYLAWGSLLSFDLDLVPLAEYYLDIIQLRFPDNIGSSYPQYLNLLVKKKEWTKEKNYVEIWHREKGLPKEMAIADLAKIHFLNGQLSKAKEILLANFSDFFQKLGEQEIEAEDINANNTQLARIYIEILRKEGKHEQADILATLLCQNKAEFSTIMVFGNKFDLMECHYLQNDLQGFLQVMDTSFFDNRSRLNHFNNLTSFRFTAFENEPRYQELLQRIKAETHRERAKIIAYLKEEGDWDPAWDPELGLN